MTLPEKLWDTNHIELVESSRIVSVECQTHMLDELEDIRALHHGSHSCQVVPRKCRAPFSYQALLVL